MRPPRSKKLIWRVRPGVCETRAKVFRPVSALTRLDLPALERPTNATSGSLAGGRFSVSVAPQMKSHEPAKSLRAASSMSAALEHVREPCRRLPIVDQVDLRTLALHHHILLQHREQGV